MTEPITPWAEHHRNEWADLTDPFRAPATDEEPWATERLVDVLGASELAIVGWAAAVAIVSAALVLVLTALGLGNLRATRVRWSRRARIADVRTNTPHLAPLRLGCGSRPIRRVPSRPRSRWTWSGWTRR